MICPACGHDNSDKATRCSACGAYLTQPAPEGGHTQPMPPRAEPQDAPQPEDVSLRDFLSMKGRKADDFLHRHQRVVAIVALLALALILAAVLLARALTNAPSNDALEADLATRAGSVSYVAGQYGSDEEPWISSVSITKRTATQSPVTVGTSLGATAYDVEAEVHYQSGSVEVVRNVGGVYAREGDQWTLVGELSDLGTSYTARAGVDQEKVVANASTLLSAAESTWKGDGSLETAYQDATFTVVGSDFEASPENDTATDEVTVHAERAGAFSAIQMDLTARFAFLDGTWQLRSVDAPQDALQPTYDQVCGTWVGTYASTSSTETPCYGASTTPFTVTIASVGDSSGARSQVTGTVSCLAHFHAPTSTSEDSDADDRTLQDVAFTGTISTAHDDLTDADLNITCKVPDTADGSVTFTLGFGPSDNPTGAVAVVETTHSYTETLLLVVPHQTSVTYTDTYVLTHGQRE